MTDNVMSLIQARRESMRCLMCADAPCTCNCPAGVDARAFIRKIRFDNLEGAVRMLKKCNVLAASCGYICPTGEQCSKGCSAKGLERPIDIGGLQRFVMDWERKIGMIEPERPVQNGQKVAVVGSGPAGLSCAAELALRGHIVTVFEEDSVFGGMLRQYIPSFRLSPDVVEFEIEFLKKLGIEFIANKTVESPKKLLSEGFKAVFVATGLSKPQSGEILNSSVAGVYQALDLLSFAKQGSLPDLGKRAVIIGGGDTALDAARIAKKSGAESFILYRRTQKEMPAYPEEIDAAWGEGVEFYFRTIVRAVQGDEKVKGVRCVRIRWHEKSALPGTPRGYDIEGQDFVVACDSVILAIGQGPEDTFGMRTTPNGMLAVDKESFETSEKGIFAGGDLSLGGGTAARAVGHGKQAAVKIDEYLKTSA